MNKVAIQLLPDKSDMTSYDVIVTSYFYITLRKWYCWPANVRFCTKMSPLCNCTYDNNEVFSISRKQNSYPIIIKKVIWQIMTSYWRHTSKYSQRKWYCCPTNLRFWEKTFLCSFTNFTGENIDTFVINNNLIKQSIQLIHNMIWWVITSKL